MLDAGVQFLPVPGAYALPVSLCDGVAALKGESESGKLGEWGEGRVEGFYALFVASTPLGASCTCRLATINSWSVMAIQKEEGGIY